MSVARQGSVRRLTEDGNLEQARKPYHLKLVLVGESNVGKSSLVERYVNNQFREYQESTIGAAFLRKEVHLPNDFTVKFEIWDTAGQERFRSLAPMYYRGAQAAIIVYDTTNYESFVKAKEWVKELERQLLTDVITALAGNKSDMTSTRKVPLKEAQQYSFENGLLFFETSAKQATNVNEIFLAIAREIEKNVQNRGGPSAVVDNEARRPRYAISEGSLDNPDQTTQAKGCCT